MGQDGAGLQRIHAHFCLLPATPRDSPAVFLPESTWYINYGSLIPNQQINMKRASLLGSVLIALVCVHVAHALVCFTCEDQTSNWKCLRMSHCPEDKQRCLTIGTVSGRDDDSKLLITKKCVESCPSDREPADRASVSLFCCEKSFCNIASPK
ncbi:lymphocyte antigen 6E-like [Sphaerodactylus townsendi]|uniref:lymphocyte antigen 6E-like n=1 Tax=Sphaerodactylus townsendi TaxID=933632 RepID=UPI002026A137|nr:lymphocyte antigen 6E-like [Sphaerodactylus townsendi]